MAKRRISKVIVKDGSPVQVVLDNGDILSMILDCHIEEMPSEDSYGVVKIKSILTDLEELK